MEEEILTDEDYMSVGSGLEEDTENEEQDVSEININDTDDISMNGGGIVGRKTQLNRTEICSVENTYSKYYKTDKVTKPFLTKYEKAKLLGIRAQMISNGSLPLVKVPANITDTYDIANLELEQKKNTPSD